MSLKVSIIGAGTVGATLAQRVLEGIDADVVLLDIVKNLACGKAMDLHDAAPILGHERSIAGTDDYAAIKDSGIVVITAGLPRKPGMTREDLIAKNAAIIKDVSKNIKMHAPAAIVIVVTNPLDVMTYLTFKETAFPPERVFGMAGVLDGGRLISLVADELKVPRASIETLVLGSHGDTMVPLISRTRVSGRPLTAVMSKENIDRIVKRTCDRGAEMVGLSGSAYYSPSAAVFSMIGALIKDSKKIFVASAYLNGQYGLKDIYIGVPCEIGKSGIKKIIELDMTEEERREFLKSAKAIKSSMELL